ncbi:MAG: hypothetical protein R3B96_17360 [Pirellulaceae bacterium]
MFELGQVGRSLVGVTEDVASAFDFGEDFLPGFDLVTWADRAQLIETSFRRSMNDGRVGFAMGNAEQCEGIGTTARKL